MNHFPSPQSMWPGGGGLPARLAGVQVIGSRRALKSSFCLAYIRVGRYLKTRQPPFFHGRFSGVIFWPPKAGCRLCILEGSELPICGFAWIKLRCLFYLRPMICPRFPGGRHIIRNIFQRTRVILKRGFGFIIRAQ